MYIEFSRGWDKSRFTRVSSLRTDGKKPFMQEDDCVVNDIPKAEMMQHNYISLLSNEYFSAPVTLTTVCSFEKFGAPLIVISDDVKPAPDGFPAYGHHFEVVAFEEGINVWELNGTDKPIKAAFARFPVEAGKKLTLTVKAETGKLLIDLDGNRLEAELPSLPSRFRAGITACEGVNRFYMFSAL